MTKREAKRMACALSADLLHKSEDYIFEKISHLSQKDRTRVTDATWDLVEELTRRGEGAINVAEK